MQCDRFTKQFKHYGDLLSVSTNYCLTVVSAAMFCFYIYNLQLLCRFVRPWLLNVWCTEKNKHQNNCRNQISQFESIYQSYILH